MIWGEMEVYKMNVKSTPWHTWQHVEIECPFSCDGSLLDAVKRIGGVVRLTGAMDECFKIWSPMELREYFRGHMGKVPGYVLRVRKVRGWYTEAVDVYCLKMPMSLIAYGVDYDERLDDGYKWLQSSPKLVTGYIKEGGYRGSPLELAPYVTALRTLKQRDGCLLVY